MDNGAAEAEGRRRRTQQKQKRNARHPALAQALLNRKFARALSEAVQYLTGNARATVGAMGLMGICGWRQPSRPPGLPPPDKPKRKSAVSRRSRRKVVPAPMPGAGAEQTWIVLGCDHAGKSTLIAGLCGKANREDLAPTCGFSKSTAALGRHRLRIFDVGGGKGIRGIWDSYYADAHGAIFVVDATEPSRFEECRGLLHAAYQHAYLIGKPLLIVANKSDLPQAIGPDELANALQMHDLAPGAHRICRAAVLSDVLNSAVTFDGIASSLVWLASAIHDDFGRLQERCAQETAEQEAADRRKKEERKARLAAKQAAREREEAEEAARTAAGQATAASKMVPASGDVVPPSPVPSPPTLINSPRVQASPREDTRLEPAELPALDYFTAAANSERATSKLFEITISPLARRVQAVSPFKVSPVGARALPKALEVESF
eukprot:scaffold744_cov111-Isochrysis_galbana.AAC.2